MNHYRVPLFNQLKKELLKRNIKLSLLYGDGTSEEKTKKDSGNLAWAKKISNKYYLDGRICWQSTGENLKNIDLLIVDQENKLILNLLLLFFPRKFKLAFFGHGANLQSTNGNSLKEKFKKWTSKKVDWWFAYTQLSKDILTSNGVNTNKITVLNNSVDTGKFNKIYKSINKNDVSHILGRPNFQSKNITIFIGSLYKEKRLDFLFVSCEKIKDKIPDFKIIIIGDGPESEKVKNWCSDKTWAKWVGFCKEKEKAAYLSISQLILNPGLVGLGIIDALVSGVPMVSTNCKLHSPEISYLRNNKNGIITNDDVNSFSNAVIELLCNKKKIKALSKECKSDATHITLNNMVLNFSDGIQEALSK